MEQSRAERIDVATRRPRRMIPMVIGLIPFVACVAAGLAIWLIFRPGNMSIDSILQIEQAVEGKFNDAHPPFMSVALSLILRLGGSVTHVVLAQCILGVLGVYLLAQGVLRRIAGADGSDGLRRWEALAVTLVLLCPISPLVVYLATFWKDVWMLIALCWVAVFALRVFDPVAERARVRDVAGLLTAMTVSILARHNALALLPIYGLIVALAVGRRTGRWAGVAAFCLPAVLYYGVDQGMRKAWNVEHWDFSRYLKVVDLAALCAENPQIEEESSYFRDCLIPGFRTHYIPGFSDNNYRYSLDEKKLATMFTPEGQARIDGEYRQAIRKHPLAFGRMRLGVFLFHLRDNTNTKFCYGIDPPRLGLTQRAETAPLREYFFRPLLSIWYGHSNKVWVFGKHWVWLAVGMAGVLSLLWRGMRQSVRRAALPLVLLTGVGYYLTYLVASCGGDFRYMYPADVLVQVVTFAGLVGCVHLAVRRLVVGVRGKLGRAREVMNQDDVLHAVGHAAESITP